MPLLDDGSSKVFIVKLIFGILKNRGKGKSVKSCRSQDRELDNDPHYYSRVNKSEYF